LQQIDGNTQGRLVSISLRALFVSLLLSLGACSLLQTHSVQTEPGIYYDWPSISKALLEQSSWRLMGKVGIRTPEESVTAAIHNWTQVDDIYKIELSSTFFGIGASSISGNAYLIELIQSGEEPIISDQPNLLIEEALGIPLPVTFLPYWIKALPVPETVYETTLNEQGLPASMTQLGWQIEFSKYSLIDTLPLPGKIKLRSEHSSITLAIKEWSLL